MFELGITLTIFMVTVYIGCETVLASSEDHKTSWDCEKEYLAALNICTETIKVDWKKSGMDQQLIDAMVKKEQDKVDILREKMRCFFLLDYVKCLDDYCKDHCKDPDDYANIHMSMERNKNEYHGSKYNCSDDSIIEYH